MENPYNGSSYQPYTPQPPQEPFPPVFEGNQTMASLSLVMAILSLLSVCCMPPALFIFAGLSILFSCLSKGQHTRPGAAKAGMAIGVSALILASLLIFSITAFFLTSEQGQDFMEDYLSILFSDEPTEEELYDFLNKYLYEGEDSIDGYDDYDHYNRFDSYEDFFEDELPFYYEQPGTVPDSSGEGEFL